MQYIVSKCAFNIKFQAFTAFKRSKKTTTVKSDISKRSDFVLG